MREPEEGRARGDAQREGSTGRREREEKGSGAGPCTCGEVVG